MTWKEIWTNWMNTYLIHRMPFIDWLEKYYEVPVKK